MADELERLLDEVERRLCRLPARAAGSGEERHEGATTAKARSSKLLKSAGTSEENIDDIFDEICNDSSFPKTPQKSKSNSAGAAPHSSSLVTQVYGKRCCPVYLGGSSSPCGIGTNISKRTCDQLRCTACDFRVSLYNDYKWDQSCDYLFFRNNMPDLNKLRAKMIRKKGSRAYACQCSWRAVDELTDLQTEQQLRWVCAFPKQLHALPYGSHLVNHQPVCTLLREQGLALAEGDIRMFLLIHYKPLQSPHMEKMSRKLKLELERLVDDDIRRLHMDFNM